jgi:hypothetical protein
MVSVEVVTCVGKIRVVLIVNDDDDDDGTVKVYRLVL